MIELLRCFIMVTHAIDGYNVGYKWYDSQDAVSFVSNLNCVYAVDETNRVGLGDGRILFRRNFL